MLVLSRKAEESIVIDNQIQVVVLGVRGNTVRIGVDAPFKISIRRMELPKRNEQDEAVIDCRGR
jgi:carbon storage regulator